MEPKIESIKVKTRKGKGNPEYLMTVQIAFDKTYCEDARIFRTVQCLEEANSFFTKMSALMGKGVAS